VSPPPPTATETETTAGPPQGSWRPRPGKLIGDVMVEQGCATREDVEAAAAAGRETNRPLGQVLLDAGRITPEDLAQCVAARFGLDYLDLQTHQVDAVAAGLIDASVAKRLEAVPVGIRPGGVLVVAMANPSNVLAVDDIAMLTGHSVQPAVAVRDDILALVARLSHLDSVVSDAVEEDSQEVEQVDLSQQGAEDAPTVKLVRSIIAQAVEQRASDIHFEPGAAGLDVRFRIDGVMVAAAKVPRRMAQSVTSRLKILGNLDIAERRLPQDGRMGMSLDGRHIDLRIVVLPLVEAESVVLRILDQGSTPLTLGELGMNEYDRARFSKALGQAHGGVLATGPTGSGKSSTLYAALTQLKSPEKTIITIEDPVEFRIEGIKQVQVNEKTDLTFARGLRAMMRADPDIVMVGEMRDRHSARIAVESALTGHLVLSTLHTNDAPTAVQRLVEMGVEPFLVASAIECVVAQRLARKLCEQCKTPVGDGTFSAGGCNRCGGTGYRGRTGLYEVMIVTQEIRKLIVDNASADAIAAVAVEQGMRRLRDDGMDKVAAGITTLAEITRVTGSS
jgi:type IV pilus assembly protein PilB